MSEAPDFGGPPETAHAPEAPPPVPPPVSRTTRLLAAVDALLAFLLSAWGHLWSWGAGALLIGAAPGLTLWPLLGSGDLKLYLDNAKLPADVRSEALLITLGSLLVMAVPYAAVGVKALRGAGRAAVGPALARLNDWLWFLVVPVGIPLLCVPKIETAHPWMVLLDALAMGAVSVVAAYRLPLRRGPPSAQTSTAGRLGPWMLLAGGALGYAITLSYFAVRQHHTLGTAVFDLGIYDNIFWQSSHGRFLAASFARGGTHVSAHCDPLLVLLSPLHLLYPHAETLLVLQSVWVASAAVPLFLLSRHHLGSGWQAALVPLCLLMYPALHGANLYDFHSLTLAAPTLLWCLYLLERRAWRAYAVALGVLLLTREDMSLLACFMGLHAIVSRHAPRAGLATIGVALVYFVAVKTLVMTDSGVFMSDPRNAYNYATYYSDMIPENKEGARGLLTTLIGHPVFTLKHALSEPKLQFFLTLFVPLLFLPFAAPNGRILMLYGFVFLFTASRTAVFSTAFQYPIVLFPLAFALVPRALAGLRSRALVPHLGLEAGRLIPALLCGMLVSGAAVSAKYGAFVHSDAFRGGFNRLNRDMDEKATLRYAKLQELIAQIGPDESVTASGRLGPHISGRRKANLFPDALENDWLLVEPNGLGADDKKRLKELRDAKCYSTQGEGQGLLLLRRDKAVPLPKASKK